ncbi:MAG: Transcriptional regulator, TetR family [Mucilaginibacter sp.]|nr:Transcriptional regulator, TetR family [Mucilaginibacter sp.]
MLNIFVSKFVNYSKMEILATDTEQLIKDTAKKVFFSEGRLHATTQEIADAAGINRASIHYYFRSRQKLFDTVFIEANTEMRSKLHSVFEEALSFRERIEKFIEVFIEKSLKHPYLEMFIVTEFNTNPKIQLHMLKPDNEKEKIKQLEIDIKNEVAEGRMKPITSHNFIITLMSLCSFPFLGRDIIKNAFSINEEEYQKLIAERKGIIMQLLFLDA